MDTVVLDREVARQQSILDALPILADVTRSDVLYYEGATPDQLVVIAHAQPHTIHSLYPENLNGQAYALPRSAPLARTIRFGTHEHAVVKVFSNGAAPVHQEVLPLKNHRGLVIGALSIETLITEFESQRTRERALRLALHYLKQAVVNGRVQGAARLSPFTARDGLVSVDRDRRIRYLSKIAEGMYSRLNLSTPLLGKTIDSLETGDEHLIGEAMRECACLEREEAVRDAIWLRKVIPIAPGANERAEPKLALLLIRDVTQERHKEREQVRLEAMIREIHHRVKNNLQTIISLTRMDARRAQVAETRRALEQMSNRIFAVAQVHESLSVDHDAAIQLKDVSRQIAQQIRESLMPLDSPISIEVEGDALSLAPKQATACALIINELVQNAVEHAFAPGAAGYIRIQLEDTPERVRIAVVDNGRGLPDGFDWQQSQSLGLRIVHTLAQELRGEFTLANQPGPSHGLIAQIRLSRMLPGGR